MSALQIKFSSKPTGDEMDDVKKIAVIRSDVHNNYLPCADVWVNRNHVGGGYGAESPDLLSDHRLKFLRCFRRLVHIAYFSAPRCDNVGAALGVPQESYS